MSCIYHRLFFIIKFNKYDSRESCKELCQILYKKSVSMELSINLYRGVV